MQRRAISCLKNHVTDKTKQTPLVGFHLLECHKRDLERATFGARTTVSFSRDAGMTKSVVVAQLPGNTRSVYNNLLEVEKESPPYQQPYLPRANRRLSDHAEFLSIHSGERQKSIETQHARVKPTNCK